MTVPRRPRPGPEDRAHTILTQTHGAPSAQGSTAAARPVSAKRLNRQYVPPPVFTSPVVVGDTTGNPGAVAISSTTGAGPDSAAAGVEAVAVGLGSSAPGRKAVAIGSGASAPGANGVAIGDNAEANAQDTIAIGNGVVAPNAYDCVIGTTNANVQIQGALIIADQSTGDMYRLDATGGVLTLVAYP